MTPGEARDQDKETPATRNPYDDGSVVNPYEADPEGLRDPWGDTPGADEEEEPERDEEDDESPRPARRTRKAAKKQ